MKYITTQRLLRHIDNQIFEDFEWLSNIQQNNDTALASLVRKYYPDLFRYGLKFTANENSIKKCILEVFVTLWKERAVADKILSPRIYLLKATRNRLQQYEPGIQHDVLRDLSFNKDKFARTLQDNLSEVEQEIVYLKYCQNLANGEIAELLNINQDSVCKLQLFAINKLANQINPRQFIGHA